MNASDWLNALKTAPKKQAIPILSFPSVSLLGINVQELIQSDELQARGMKEISQRVPSGASVSMMDLSVEAEAFGSAVRFDPMEVPAVMNIIVHNEAEARALEVPPVGAGRTGLYIEAIKNAAQLIQDRPVFAGMIGPFSLSGRLLGVSETLLYCYDDPELVELVMEKATRFLTEYALAYKQTGALGVVIAEPLTGLLSPALAEEVSHPFVKKIIKAVQDENFIVVYHNCGDSASKMVESLVKLGARAYHFGNKANMLEVMRQLPPEIIGMGNVDPSSQFRNGTPQSIYESTTNLLRACGQYRNFVPSSGCDIPPATPWENIESFFAAVEDFYKTI
ncbi:MAG: uroporphyrinogen decarboxylase family protein [Clostridiaceae bacterium]